MNDLQLFNYEDNTVRTIMMDGQVWFVAKDVCDILGHTNSRMAVQELAEDEKGVSKVYTPGGEQDMAVINEPGLYRLIFRSNKPEAKAFQYWVYHEVLPALHHTGNYSIGQNTVPVQVDPLQVAKVVFEAAHIKDNQLALALDKVGQHYTGQSMLALGGVTLIAPVQEQLITPTDIGKHFGVSARKINQVLIDNAYQRKVGRGYEPLKLGEPFAVMLDVNKWHGIGTPTSQLKWRSGIIDELDQYFD